MINALTAFIADRRRGGCAPGTIALYLRQLDAWTAWLRERDRPLVIDRLTIDDLRGFEDYLRSEHIPYSSEASTRPPLRRPLSENTLASYHRTLRAFWSFLHTEGLLTDDQKGFFRRLSAPKVPEDPRPVTDEVIVKRLMHACGDGGDEESARNRAIVQLLYESGMRISELCNLTDEVVNLAKRSARVLRPKNKRHRMVFWQPSGASVLARYLLMRRGKHGGPLFRGCSTRNKGGPMTPDAVRKAIKRIAENARIKLPYGAPLHSIRHGFAHAAIEAGAELSDLADLLGHADLETTRIYVRNDDTRLATTYDRIFSRSRSRLDTRRNAESAD